MKRKYYLRGLAVGVILTTVILTIANADNKPMTDAEVRQRALELGMIESDSRKLSDVGESSSEESGESYDPSIHMVESGGIDGETVGDEISTPASESETNESEGSTTDQSASGETQSTESEASTADGAGSASRPPASTDGAADGSVPPASSTTETTESAETTTSGESEDFESGEPVIITIKSGDSSYTVSKALAAAGLVEDAVEYDDYLCDNGYSRKIRTGTYEIMPGMSYEEIAQMIAR